MVKTFFSAFAAPISHKKFLSFLLALSFGLSVVFQLSAVPILASANGGDDDHKVTICHIPPGNPENMQTIEIDLHALSVHVSHHGDGEIDEEGECDDDDTPPPPPPTPTPTPTPTPPEEHKVTICHIPSDDPANMQTIEVDDNSVNLTAHLAHGDTLGACTPPPPPPPAAQKMTIVATKIVCDEESKLPNWGLGGPNITSTTATDYVAAHPGCVLTPDWKFQWGLSDVTDPGRSHVGFAPSADWHTFGPTNASGVATVEISDFASSPRIWIREVLKDGFIPFTFDSTHTSNSDTVSAEMYCHTDVLNYDNYDWVAPPQLGSTYYCVAFNVAKTVIPPPPPTATNTAPVITVTLPNPTNVLLGGVFTDLGATAFDAEDGVINPANIVATGAVNTAVLGTYTISYNVNDSQGLAAATKTRTVNVVSVCADGVDNDNDGKTDFPDDLGCESITDDSENNRPVITVTLPNPTIVTLGQIFIDLGATAVDVEDGIINPANIVVSGTVNTAVVADYTISYNVNDSQGLAAATKTRTVKVLPACSDTKNNDADNVSDFPADLGCENPNDNDENDPPVITVLGANPLNILVNTTFTDPGATALDAEDGVITPVLATGTVNTTVVGTYTITYNVTDSQGQAAVSKTRTVNVNPAVTECNDDLDNDGDGSIDHPADTGCDDPNDNDENDRPVITVLGADPLSVQLGGIFTDPGANASDAEDCVGKTQAQCNTALSLTASGTVNMSAIGSYIITYTAIDSDGLTALPKTRLVNVITACSDGVDNDGDGLIDTADTGCDNPEDNDENSKPVITLLGSVMMDIVINTTFTDPGANATDTEDCIGLTQADCNTTLNLTATGTVNTAVLGAYVITYNATDTDGLAADTKTRTVNVIPGTPPPPPVCTQNCGGGGGGTDNLRPVITLIGADPLDVVIGTSFIDPGATATDPEDGDRTSFIVVTGGPVNTSTVSNYTLSYNVLDSQGLAAAEVRRAVRVIPAPTPVCTQNCGGGGGGGGGPIPLTIFNERIETVGTSTTVTITWNTNAPADSRVVYGLNHLSTIGLPPNYGYPLTTATQTAATTTHRVVIAGIPSGISSFFRPISTDSTRKAIGIELERKPVVIGEVLGESTCNYLRTYMRLGYNNNPNEVKLLQQFLRDYEGHSTLAVTGFFDITTDKAVRAFQDKYKEDVLDTWKLPGNTGYVYYTTQKKINELYCQREFPLAGFQVQEIAQFRELIDRVTGVAVPKSTTFAVRDTDTTIEIPEIHIDTTSGVESDMLSNLRAEDIGEIASGAAREKLPGAGRLSLGDLLATSPANGALSATSDNAVDGTDVADENIESERNVAAVGESLTSRVKDTIISFFSTVVEGVKNVFKKESPSN